MAKEDTLVVHELYTSIQGESSFVGLPCTFIRLTGCNLRCVWCDTQQAFRGGTRRARRDVLDEALTTKRATSAISNPCSSIVNDLTFCARVRAGQSEI